MSCSLPKFPMSMVFSLLLVLFQLQAIDGRAQASEIRVVNQTGFDLDSVVLFQKTIAHLPKDSIAVIAPFSPFYSSSGIPLDVPKAIIRGAKQVPAHKNCGTKAVKITRGKHAFNLTVYETGLGLCLRYVPHIESKR